jgi:uncharacterized protein (TIGR02596 family)
MNTVSPRTAVYRTTHRAFSLLELLVVLAILGIVSTLAITGISGIQRSTAMATSSSQLLDYLAIGRQSAITLNQPVRVWFCPGDPNDSLLLYTTENGVDRAVEKALKLNQQIVLSSNAEWSSVLTEAVSGSKTACPKLPAADCYSFQFLPDGSTDLGGTASPTITLVHRTDAGNSDLPANFFTIQIDQQNGTVRTFRPQ